MISISKWSFCWERKKLKQTTSFFCVLNPKISHKNGWNEYFKNEIKFKGVKRFPSKCKKSSTQNLVFSNDQTITSFLLNKVLSYQTQKKMLKQMVRRTRFLISFVLNGFVFRGILYQFWNIYIFDRCIVIFHFFKTWHNS